MAFSLSSCKAFTPTTTTATVVSQFPDNPKTLILEQCKTFRDAKQIHAHVIKTGHFLNPILAEHLLESSSILIPGSMDYALSIFRAIDDPNPAAYNILIRGFTLKSCPENAIMIFKQMLESSVDPNTYTFPCVLKACSKLKALKEGEQIHGQLFKFGFGSHEFVQNTLIHLYANCGRVQVARRVFDGMLVKGVITWNSMFAGYTKSGCWEEVVKLFHEMLQYDVAFDDVTMISVLMASGRLGDLKLGELINDSIETKGLKGNLNLITSLVDMYAKCGQVDTARRLFDEMPRRDVVAWSAMISGYSQSNRCREALTLFHQMQKAKVDPNEITLVSVLSSCAVMGAFETGKWVHSFIKKKRLQLTVTLGTALMDFYAKCGSIDNSLEVFEKMPSKNVLSWTVLIQGLASNGQGRKALEFFSLMQKNNIEPNDVTFIGVLSACSHAGLVDEGRGFFVSMNRDFGIEPRIEHYGCMVDILSRAGLIEEAYQFIKNMPIEPNSVVWRTLLASCKVHKNVEIGEESLKQLSRLDPTHSGDYILLSNIYASVGWWEDALKVRSLMKEKGIKKTPGCSSIELDGVIHEFFAEDSSHPQSKEIYGAVEDIIKRIKSAGYVPNTAEARLDAEEHGKEASVSHHSEKLAIAFGLIKTSPRTTIRISKNLRVCTDCHTATKMISRVYNREIVVRDRNRFHHFKEGLCSCNDYW
ncbi:pentatricopeptide repeat-containing protein At1g08070, chloroplastic-like [Telopea speciosissima]|uniref:pentatricopeptide repeat-containing protein At1g08070, chloroplastic-like n=1 Tax=Telopea speciosissima TaxID=54955 RepID=UPI001CC5C0AF|nr:pentatricopeptide repeat-containing protein At1g08070, chloroplastic-like [Telopea speciosissima]